MKIVKYLASALALATMAFSFSSCDAENDVVDAKSQYLFDFVINKGSLTDAQLLELNDSIDSKIYGSVGAAHYPMYCTQDYALQSYETAASDDSLLVKAIINPIADKHNVTDFSVNMQLKYVTAGADSGTIVRGDMVYVPTVERKNYDLGVEVKNSANANDVKTQIVNIIGTTTQNSTQTYAVNTFLNDKAEQIQALLNSIAAGDLNDDLQVVISATTGGETIKSKTYAPVCSFIKQFVVSNKGSLSDEGVAELETLLLGTVFDGLNGIKITKTKEAAVSEINLDLIKKGNAIQKDVDAIADKYAVDDFEVIVQLINAKGELSVYEGNAVEEKFYGKMVKGNFRIAYEITQGSLSAVGLDNLNTQIKNILGGETIELGTTTQGYANAQLNNIDKNNGSAIKAAIDNVAIGENGVIADVKVTLKLVSYTDAGEELVTSIDYTPTM